MLLTKWLLITRINSIGCELPLIGGWGVLYFSEWTLNSNGKVKKSCRIMSCKLDSQL